MRLDAVLYEIVVIGEAATNYGRSSNAIFPI